MAEPIEIGILLYPNVTQLDATGPAQVLCRVPGARLHMIWKTRDPVPTDAASRSSRPRPSPMSWLDVICAGGGGQVALMTIQTLTSCASRRRRCAASPRCAPALVLGAAGASGLQVGLPLGMARHAEISALSRSPSGWA